MKSPFHFVICSGRRRYDCLLLALLCSASSPRAMRAQTSTADLEAKPDVLTLNPFNVNADQDKGFVASSSLAGGRLSGELKDTPVAYSVLTKDFIDALQLTDLNQMAAWAPNNSARNDNGVADTNGTGVLVTTRGVNSSNPQRNFFPYGFNFDSYNIERLDLARGANSILFGTGTNGGTANSVTKQARTDRQFTELRASSGSWENYRFTLDHNQPLTETLAFRVNGLYADRRGWMDRDYERKKAATLSATWKPFRTTEFRVEAEKGRRDRAIITTSFDDYFSGWNGISTFNAPITTAAASTGVARTAARYVVFTPSSGLDKLMNYEGWAMTTGGNATAATPVGGVLVVGPSANISANPVSAVNLPDSRFNLATANSHLRLPTREAATTVDAPLWGQNYDDLTLALTQQVGDHFFAEAAVNLGHEKIASNFMPSRGQGRIYIDINSKLPDGSPNPNYLEPYGESPSYDYNRYNRNASARLSLGYVLDNTRWGDFHFNVIGGESVSDQTADSFIYVLKTNADPRQWPTYEQVRFRYYYNTDVARPLPHPDSWTYVDPVSGTTKSVPAGLVRDYTNSGLNQRTRITYKYIQAAGSAKLFHDRINLLGAIRRDQYETKRQSIVERQDQPANWDGYSFIAKPSAPADWESLTYRARDASGNQIGPVIPATTRPLIGLTRDPRYANDRFQDDYSPENSGGTVDTFSAGAVIHATKQMSVFVNYAESFVPPSQQYDIYGNFFKPQAATGWDYGLRFTFLEGALVANVLRYTGVSTQRSISNGTFGANINGIINASPIGADSSAINARGLLPLAPYLDSADSKTEGWELEVTANLTSHWRLMANAALPKAYQTNTYPGTLSYLAKYDQTFRQILADTGALIDSKNVATMDPAVSTSQSPKGPAAVAGWNGIQTMLASIVTDPQKLTRLTEVTANLFTDYSFHTGWLRGFRVGGGVNYRGREVIGYKGADTIRDPSNPNVAIDDPTVGALDTVNGRAYATATLTLNYTRRLSKKRALSLDFKVDNLFDYDRPIYYATVLRPPGGDLSNPARVTTPQKYYWLTPRNYTFATTLKF